MARDLGVVRKASSARMAATRLHPWAYARGTILPGPAPTHLFP